MSYLDKPARRVVGTRPIRPDGVDKVTGRANFGADMTMPGMLWGRIKRGRLSASSTEPSAKGVPHRWLHRAIPGINFPRREAAVLGPLEG